LSFFTADVWSHLQGILASDWTWVLGRIRSCPLGWASVDTAVGFGDWTPTPNPEREIHRSIQRHYEALVDRILRQKWRKIVEVWDRS